MFYKLCHNKQRYNKTNRGGLHCHYFVKDAIRLKEERTTSKIDSKYSLMPASITPATRSCHTNTNPYHPMLLFAITVTTPVMHTCNKQLHVNETYAEHL
jgi:hypothetical protein